MRKKTFIALLFSGFILLPLLFSAGLQGFQLYLKQNVSYRLEHDELVSFSIPLSQVQWMEEGREILVEGKMFDLKTYHEENGFLLVEGVFDEKETRILEFFHDFNEAQQNQLLVHLFIFAPCFFICLFHLLIPCLNQVSKRHAGFLLCPYNDPFFSPIAPPPRAH